MTKSIELNNLFQFFQQTGLNCGGIWKIIEIANYNNISPIDCIKQEIGDIDVYKDREKYKKYFSMQSDNFGLELIELEKWKSYFEKRIEYWSNFEPLWKKEKKSEFIQEEYDESKSNFLSILNNYLVINKLSSVMKINEDKFNNYKTEWGDQISEDFVFVLNKKILLIHFGWSS